MTPCGLNATIGFFSEPAADNIRDEPQKIYKLIDLNKVCLNVAQ